MNYSAQNLSKFFDDPYAVPSQVQLAGGSATTNNSVSPSITTPLSDSTTITNTLASTVAAATSSTATNTNTTNQLNKNTTISASDQWTQTWSIDPVTDPDQLRRLRALYRFAAFYHDAHRLLCEYPLVEKSGGGSGAPATTVTFNQKEGSVTVRIGEDGANDKVLLLQHKLRIVRRVHERGREFVVQFSVGPAAPRRECLVARDRQQPGRTPTSKSRSRQREGR
jgi:hypothetical protein